MDALVRISSNTKPMAAALALSLAEEGALALDDPVERLVPELADRRVLRRLDGPLDDTVPAVRPITVEDLLTMRMGFGFVFEGDCPALGAAAQAGLGIGPPDPSVPLPRPQDDPPAGRRRASCFGRRRIPGLPDLSSAHRRGRRGLARRLRLIVTSVRRGTR